jgi:hypothetical protein
MLLGNRIMPFQENSLTVPEEHASTVTGEVNNRRFVPEKYDSR